MASKYEAKSVERVKKGGMQRLFPKCEAAKKKGRPGSMSLHSAKCRGANPRGGNGEEGGR